MDHKLISALLDSHSQEKGFTFPLALAMGLIMLLVGTTMMVRSKDDQVNAVIQKQTAQSLAVAEAGISQVVNHLAKHPEDILGWPQSTEWSDWKDIDPNEPNLGQYKFLFERDKNWPDAPPGVITLSVEGKVGDAKSAVRVKIPFDAKAATEEGPGLWVREDDGSGDPIDVPNDNQSINANVWIQGTSFDSSKIGEDNLERDSSGSIEIIYGNSSSSAPDAPYSLPDTVRDPNPIPIVTAKDPVDYPMPQLPSPPADAYSLPVLDLSDCYVRLPRRKAESNTDCSNVSGAFNGIGSDDTPTEGVYSYLIDSTALTGGDSIVLSNAQIRIDLPAADEKVVLFVRGNIALSGTSGPSDQTTLCQNASNISNNVSTYINSGPPSNLAIYGANGSTSWNDYKITSINPSDTTIISAFIYAPSVLVDVSQAEIRGAVWAKRFQSSNSPGNSSGCDIAVNQESVGKVHKTLTTSPDQAKVLPITSFKLLSNSEIMLPDPATPPPPTPPPPPPPPPPCCYDD